MSHDPDGLLTACLCFIASFVLISVSYSLEKIHDGCPIDEFIEVERLFSNGSIDVIPINSAGWWPVKASGKAASIINDSGYEFLFKSTDESGGYAIMASSRFGGRSYVYSKRWSIARLAIDDRVLNEEVGTGIRLFFDRKLSKSEESVLFDAIPISHRFFLSDTIASADIDSKRLFIERTMAIHCGGLIGIPSLQDFVVSICLDHADTSVRRNAIRSVLSFLEIEKTDINPDLIKKIRARLETLQSEITEADQYFSETEAELLRELLNLVHNQ